MSLTVITDVVEEICFKDKKVWMSLVPSIICGRDRQYKV